MGEWQLERRKRTRHLADALDDADCGRQAAEALRSLIGAIVLTPGAKRGELFGILDFIKAEERQRGSPFMPAVVACPGKPIQTSHTANNPAPNRTALPAFEPQPIAQ